MTTLNRRALLLGAATGLSLAANARAQSQDPFAIVGATWWRPDAAPLKDAVVVVEKGEVRYAGDDRSQASGAREIVATGKVVTAGLCDLLTQVGLIEVRLEQLSRDDSHDIDDPVRAAFRAADGFDPNSTVVAITRQHGMTSAGIVPSGGLVSGQSAWVDLAGSRDSVAEARMALHISLDDGAPRRGAYHASTGASLLRLRELFDDASALQANPRGYDRRQMRALGASRLDLLAVVDALEGKYPVVFHVDRASDIVAVLDFAKKQGVRAVLASCAEGWRVADSIAAAEVPAIVYPLDEGPRSFKARYAREDNAAKLRKAGVRVALSTGQTHMARKLRQVAGNAIRAGLSTRDAIDGVTAAPAAIMGMKNYGVLKKGNVANLALWSGDPFELSSKVEQLFIRGRSVSLRSRQTALFERYR
jgi:imidazolonepropionase-like amidohydrolase